MKPVRRTYHPPAGTSRLALIVLVCAALLTVLAAPVSAGSKVGENERQSLIAVKLRPNIDASRFAGRHGLRVAEPLLPSRGIYMLEPSDGRQLEKGELKKKAKDLAKLSGVYWAESEVWDDEIEDDRFHAWPEGVPSDQSDEADRWLNQENLAFLRLDVVHQRATGVGMTVALLDTGVDMDHPQLAEHIESSDGPSRHFDYVDDDRIPMEETNRLDDDRDGLVDEAYGHGTHTAGLVVLVAPDAELLVYRVLDTDGYGNPYLVAEAINDAVAAGADVINVSFGMSGKPKSKVLREAFKNAAKADVVIVAAVGNDAGDDEHYPSQEKNIIGVAAMANGNNDLANFSNYGKQAMVAAPGEDVVSTLPGGGFGAWSGTSMAAPIVAGQVALVKSTDVDREVKKVVEIVGKSSRKIRGKRKIEKGLIDIVRSVEDS